MNGTLLLSDDELSGAFAGCSPQAVADFHERRSSNRWLYPAVQPLAPYGHWGFPHAEMFQYVRCHDLSTGGVSFFLLEPPTFEFAVIGLGVAPQFQYFVIQKAYCRRCDSMERQYLVGCQFLQRIKPPAQASRA